MYPKEQRIVKDIKKIIERTLSESQEFPTKQKISEILSEQMQYAYDTLSEIFSSAEGITLERFIIRKRLEK